MRIGPVARNAGWIIGCKLAQAVLALLVNMGMARYMGPSHYGLIGYAASVVAFAVPVMQLGIPDVIVGELVKRPEEEGAILGTSLVLSGISSVACIVAVAAFANVTSPGDPELILICGLYSLVLFFRSMELLQFWFQARLRSRDVSLAALAASLAVSCYQLLLLAARKLVFWFSVTCSIESGILVVSLFALYRIRGGAALSFSGKIARGLLSKGKYYIVSNMMVTAFAQIDRIMLQFAMGSTEVGYYTAAVAIAGMTSFVFTAVIQSCRPVILQAWGEDSGLFSEKMSQLYGLVFYGALAQSLVITVAAEPVVRILYGTAYLDMVTTLRILVWYTAFSYLGGVRNVWVLAKGLERYLWMLNVSGVGMNILLNALLIPFWGKNGAALASLVTQIFTNVVMTEWIRPLKPANRLLRQGLRLDRLFRYRQGT